jgi:AcrB/AcrD/AcrF family protein/biotin/lipoyl-binding protein
MMSRTGLAEERSTRTLSFALGTIVVLVLMLFLAACRKAEKAATTTIRPVRTVTVEQHEGGERVSLTGEIQPRYHADIGFRVNGKILQRPVDVGTQVRKGDLIARLDPQQYRQDFEVAKSEVAAAEAEVTRSQAQEYRQRELLKNGHTTQVAYDQAVKTFKTAHAQLDAARAKQIQASENLGYTDLLMLIILMVQLQSFQKMFLVISVAPLGLIGVVAALLPTGTPMGFVAILGIIALSGMIIRNSVILIDQIDMDIAKGLHAWDAVVDATTHRLRPIVLTAAAASLGMIPIAPEVFWGPMAYAIIGGLFVATLLTLLFLPALYVAWFRIKEPAKEQRVGVTEPMPATAPLS